VDVGSATVLARQGGRSGVAISSAAREVAEADQNRGIPAREVVEADQNRVIPCKFRNIDCIPNVSTGVHMYTLGWQPTTNSIKKWALYIH